MGQRSLLFVLAWALFSAFAPDVSAGVITSPAPQDRSAELQPERLLASMAAESPSSDSSRFESNSGEPGPQELAVGRVSRVGPFLLIVRPMLRGEPATHDAAALDDSQPLAGKAEELLKIPIR